ncbi:Asp-tRNA(Asn)/Glu-tRNA(Gln) amidotransferase subunit GatA [Mycoplasma sp. Pen4]|uniref:amidase family protein n=1 Tax=Mycoplasma sp. Pen4 TaxID=640330 RepID=UPI0016540B76|nr:amidase family protein [Mycoplasma sp. Pen4]QNM93707.1 Asp-tRNA(Asn)/Glu-tRNA(Gln) amidotransferase subunit GatA [Mycoplasma sp. Pen4]
MRKIKNIGNYDQALDELKNNTNNAVSDLYLSKANSKDGILSGAVLTIKDVFATKEHKTQASSMILKDFMPHYNATAVQKLLDAGCIPVAKLHNDELALGGTGTFSAFGLISNPKDEKRYVGGSSSGSAATMTKNIAIALGSDTGDSVRLPASFNSLVGFKPSYGAISRYGMFAYASSLDTVAYFTHNVNDAILASQALFGVDNKDMTSVAVEINNVTKTKPNKVIALDFSKFAYDYVNDSFNKLIQKLNEQGVEVEIIKPNLDILRAINIVYKVVSFSEASSNLANLNGVAFGNREEGNTWEEVMFNTRSSHFGKMVQERLALGSYFLYTENQEDIFLKSQKARRVIKDYLASLHLQADVVIYPASAGIAPLFTSNETHDVLDYILTGSNLSGNPSITIPMGQKDGLGYSVAIDAGIYQDQSLLGFAEYLEEIINN